MVVSVIANLSLSGEYRGWLTFTSTGKDAAALVVIASAAKQSPGIGLKRRRQLEIAASPSAPRNDEAL
jgi:hypothetical protein